MTVSLKPYLIRDAVSAVSAERTGIATYPFGDRASFADPEYETASEVYEWLGSCAAGPYRDMPCVLEGGESRIVWVALESQVASAICNEHVYEEKAGGRRLFDRLRRVDQAARDRGINATELHALACRGTYAENAEWTPLEWAERVLKLSPPLGLVP